MAPVIKPPSHKRQPALATAPIEDLSLVIRDARLRFMEAFDGHCEALAPANPETAAVAVQEAVKLLHRMTGLGGTIGFHRLSAKAAEMEERLIAQQRHPDDMRDQVAQLRAAFAQDVANPTLQTAQSATPVATTALHVLLVEDEPLQRRVLSAQLRKAGHEPIEVASGEEVLDAARAKGPDVILLDVELPGIDGYTVCRMLKADPALAATPVVFLSAHADVESRLTGLSHGADDFLTKPIDPRELSLRLEMLARRSPRTAPRPAPEAAPGQAAAKNAFSELPARPGDAPCILVGDDDQDTVRIVDAHLGALGYRRILAYDGAQTLEEARAQHPDVIILDLMMPKLTGYEVLAGLKEMGDQRPKVLVLSARGRQEDVIKAFSLGANDFLVKPFNPQELLGRLARLVEAPVQARRTA